MMEKKNKRRHKYIRRDLNILQREVKGQGRNRAKVEELENEYHFNSKKFSSSLHLFINEGWPLSGHERVAEARLLLRLLV